MSSRTATMNATLRVENDTGGSCGCGTTVSPAHSSNEKKHAPWVDAVAGGFGGALAKCLLAPFQRIVVLQQLGEYKRQYGITSSHQLARIVIREEGLMGFWRGNLTSMIIRVPYSGIQFVLYTNLKFLLQERWRGSRASIGSSGTKEEHYTRELIDNFVLKCGAGGVSAAVAGTIVYPGEVVRLRLMSGEKQFNGIWRTSAIVFKETNSFAHFYSGLGASLAQRVPDILVSFATYETVKYGLLDAGIWGNTACTIVGGSLAALASIAVSFPLDVAKRRLGMSGSGKIKIKYRGISHCLMDIWRHEGFGGWYAGATLEAIRCVPQVVLMWFFIEGIQRELTTFASNYNRDTVKHTEL